MLYEVRERKFELEMECDIRTNYGREGRNRENLEKKKKGFELSAVSDVGPALVWSFG